MAFSHDGKMLAIALEAWRRVQVREVPSLQLRHELLDQAEGVFAVSFSPDDRTLFSAGGDQTIRCWGMGNGDLKWVRHGHTGKVWGLAVSPDGRTVASASGDGTVKLWDPEPPRDHDTITIEGHLAALQLSRDGKLIAALDRDGPVLDPRVGHRTDRSLWTARSARLLAAITSTGLGRDLRDLRTMSLADAEGTVTVWDAEAGPVSLAALGDRDGPVLSRRGITPDGTHGYLVRPGRQAEFWDLRRARRLEVLKGQYGYAIALLDGDRWLIHDPERNRPVIWEPTRVRVTTPRTPIRFMPQCVGLSLDGRRLALFDRL